MVFDLVPAVIFVLLLIVCKFPVFPFFNKTPREDKALLFQMDSKLSEYDGKTTHGLITRDAWWDWFNQVRVLFLLYLFLFSRPFPGFRTGMGEGQ